MVGLSHIAAQQMCEAAAEQCHITLHVRATAKHKPIGVEHHVPICEFLHCGVPSTKGIWPGSLNGSGWQLLHLHVYESKHEPIARWSRLIGIDLLYALVIHDLGPPIPVHRTDQQLDLLNSQMRSNAHPAATAKRPKPTVHLFQLLF